MTRHSPDSDDGRLPDNLDSENTEDDEGFRDALTERTIEVETNTDEDESGNHQNGHNGYEPLPASVTGAMMPEDDDEDDKIEFGYSNFDGEQFHTRTSADYRHLLEEPASENSRSGDEPAPIPLDTARIETIKSIMSNITLPSSAVPNWASTVSDDDLKQVVDEKLSKKSADKEDWAKFD